MSGQQNLRGVAASNAGVFWITAAGASGGTNGGVWSLAAGGTRIVSQAGDPVAVVADDNAVYWGDQTGNAVLKYDLGTSTWITLATGQTNVHDLAIDTGTGLYWVNQGPYTGQGQEHDAEPALSPIANERDDREPTEQESHRIAVDPRACRRAGGLQRHHRARGRAGRGGG